MVVSGVTSHIPAFSMNATRFLFPALFDFCKSKKCQHLHRWQMRIQIPAGDSAAKLLRRSQNPNSPTLLPQASLNVNAPIKINKGNKEDIA